MAETRSAGEKTEQPTPHRRREARRRGQVAKSADLNAAINMLGMVILLLFLGELVFQETALLLTTFLGSLYRPPLETDALLVLTKEAFSHYVRLIAPVFLAAAVLGVGANLFQVGFLASPNLLAPQFDRLNPLNGIKRIFSRRSLFEMMKVVLKLFLFSMVIFLFLRGRFEELLLLMNQTPGIAALTFWNLAVSLGLRVALVFLLLAVADYLFQRHEFEQSLRMTRKEVKDEYKQMEGDPLLRAKLREKQRYYAQQRMLGEVPTADVVITNPTDLALALRYAEGRDAAPVLVAKGAGVIARRIREIADLHDIPIVENKEVARLLFREAEIGEEIPVELYRAVAEILALIYRLRKRKGEADG